MQEGDKSGLLIEDAGTHWLCGMLHVVNVIRLVIKPVLKRN